MKVNNPNLSSLNPALTAAETSRAQEATRASAGRSSGPSQSGRSGSSDDVHLSELVRSLRSLAAESPERQAHIEQLTRTYARGAYQVNAQALAGKVIDDALSY